MDDVLEHDYLKSHHMLLKLIIINFSLPMIFILLLQYNKGPTHWNKNKQLSDLFRALMWISYTQVFLLAVSILLPKPSEKWVKFS